MFHVNLSALNPVFKDGLTSTYNEQTNQLEVSLNAVIPDTTNLVTTDTEQTISGLKTFTGGLRTENTTFGLKMNIGPGRFQYDYNNQGTIERTLFDLPSKTAGTEQEPTTYTLATTDDIPSLSDYAVKSEVPSLDGYATQTWVQNQGYATSSEIPTVNNPTITFTQGGVAKGSITLNQSADQTIEFDAGGGGGGSSAPYEISNMEIDSTNQTITLTIVANS